MPCKPFQWTSQSIGSFWDAVASSPLDQLSFGLLAGDMLIDYLYGYLPTEGRILDFGAGSGHLARALLRRGYCVATFEPSPERARKMEATLGGSPNFLGAMTGASSEQYDVVIVSEVLEHVPEEDMAELMHAVVQYIRTDGLLIITTPNTENLSLNEAICPACHTQFHRWQHLRSFTADTLEAMILPYGMRTRVLGAIGFAPDTKFIEGRRALARRTGAFLEELRAFEVQVAAAETELRKDYDNLLSRLRQSVEDFARYEFVPSEHIVEDRRVRVGDEDTIIYIGQLATN